MSDFLEEIEHIVDATIPDKDELIHEGHRDRDYAMLITRNLLVGVAAVLFILSFFFEDIYHILRVKSIIRTRPKA